ncbi:hypothetical protein EFK50_09080 [Nocardioides marmoriginsengisoli]|uniref:Uncharacterized protein n=1 Tax=Nocardioides marmoriginsengisoli TaxID=661483 RepID=A0A3N0CG56_9ACTN|nr:DUF6518 family protein [Nocardioides marmoriginsengisoli]RNL61973.1 hypothetical protein EFK50_09080 [Nocardioides marmoriginsengisoli]
MTTLTDTVPRASLTDLRLLAVAVASGIVLGVGDLVVMMNVPFPWANLANSSAVWALGAFVLGAVLRVDPLRTAIAGSVMLVVAVEAYYGYAALIDMGGVAALWSEVARTWMVFGVFAGVIFGVAGAWTSGSAWWQRVVGSAFGAAVLLGEALHTWANLNGQYGRFRTELMQTSIVMAVLGVLVLVVSARRPAVLTPAAVAAVPTAVFCAAAFSAIGIAY